MFSPNLRNLNVAHIFGGNQVLSMNILTHIQNKRICSVCDVIHLLLCIATPYLLFCRSSYIVQHGPSFADLHILFSFVQVLQIFIYYSAWSKFCRSSYQSINLFYLTLVYNTILHILFSMVQVFQIFIYWSAWSIFYRSFTGHLLVETWHLVLVESQKWWEKISKQKYSSQTIWYPGLPFWRGWHRIRYGNPAI